MITPAYVESANFYWKLDEPVTNKTVIDTTPNGRNGDSNFLKTTDGLPITGGLAKLNERDRSHLLVNNAVSDNTNVTIAGWYKIKPGTQTNYAYDSYLGGLTTKAAYGAAIGVSNSGHYAINLCGTAEGVGSGHLSIPGPISVVNEWVHLALTKEGTLYKLYVNGEFSHSARLTHDVGTTFCTTYYNGGTFNTLHYAIDELILWERTLTEKEIKTVYSSYVPRYLMNDNGILKKINILKRPGNLIPKMLSNTSPSGVASASTVYDSSYPAHKAFDHSYVDNPWAANTNRGWLMYQFPKAIAVRKYTVTGRGTALTQSPKSWTFEGSHDSLIWDILDVQTNITNWSTKLTQSFLIEEHLVKEYLYYRINVTANNGNAYLAICELEMEETDDYVLEWEEAGATPLTEDSFFNAMTHFELSLINKKMINELEFSEPELLLCYPSRYDYAPNFKMVAVAHPQVIKQNTDIPIHDVDFIESLRIKETMHGESDIRIAFSFDEGRTWKTKNTTEDIFVFETISPTIEEMKEKGMTPDVFDSINKKEWITLRGISNTIRFAFYLDSESSTKISAIDELLSIVQLKGEWVHYEEADVSYSNRDMLVSLYKNGTFKITYEDVV